MTTKARGEREVIWGVQRIVANYHLRTKARRKPKVTTWTRQEMDCVLRLRKGALAFLGSGVGGRRCYQEDRPAKRRGTSKHLPCGPERPGVRGKAGSAALEERSSFVASTAASAKTAGR